MLYFYLMLCDHYILTVWVIKASTLALQLEKALLYMHSKVAKHIA